MEPKETSERKTVAQDLAEQRHILLNLRIGESHAIGENKEMWLTRVPNGWVFTNRVGDALTGSLVQGCCFIPERLPADPVRPAEPAW